MIKCGAVSIPGIEISGFPKLNQDAAACVQIPSATVAVISDGAGSAKYSNVGSTMVVRQFSRSLDRFNIPSTLAEFENVVSSTINKIRQRLRRLSSLYNLETNLAQFHATLVFALITDSKCFIAHLGDGTCMLFNQNHELIYISLPENGEYENETYFITEDNWLEHLRCLEVSENVSSCLLMSDGVTPLAVKANRNFPPFTTPILNYLQKSQTTDAIHAVTETLNSDSVKKISTDDKSLAWCLRC